MAPRRLAGLLLIVLGAVVLLSGGLFWKQKDKILDTDSVDVTVDRHRGFSVPPVVSGVCIVAGIVLLVLPERSRS